LESFADYLKNRNINNLFEIFWDKHTKILNATWKKVLEAKEGTKLEKNKTLLVRIYPKFVQLFEKFLKDLVEFMLKYPDPSDEIDFRQLRDKLLEGTKVFSESYYESVHKEINVKLDQITKSIFTADSSFFKTYTGAIHSELAKLSQFLNFETKENILSPTIFSRFMQILADDMYIAVKDLYQTYDNTDAKNLSLNKIFCLFTTFFELKRVLVNVIDQKYNQEIQLNKIDEVLKVAGEYENTMLIVLFHNLNDHMGNQMNLLLEHYKKNFNAKTMVENDVLNNIYSFFLNYSLFVNKSLDKNHNFSEQWSNLMSLMIYLFATVVFYFDTSNEKFRDVMNRDFEFLGNALEKFNKKDTNHRLILINIQKLATFMEAPDVLLYLENNHDFVKSIPKPLLILYFMKKLERETKVILSGIKKKRQRE